MAITTIKASKATPSKALDYITDKGKAALVSTYKLDPSQDLAEQMMATARIWGKAQEEDDRKYYHLKISFAPQDWTRNGGPLTEQEALQIGMDIMEEFCPGNESVGSVHTDQAHLHFHGVINAVDLETGKMMDMRRSEYRRMKDRVQEICAERGLTAIDWRQATKDKRAREQQPDDAVTQTFAEKGLQERGKAVWKDDLRNIIDQAATSCTTMDEFRAQLLENGVTLTRCTDQTISYKLGDHRACRGDTLGADYTVAAIRDALAHNCEPGQIRKGRLDDMIATAAGKAAGGEPVSLERRQMARAAGRLAGVPRGDIDAMCDHAPKATWEEKQQIWNECLDMKAEMWEDWRRRNEENAEKLKKAYDKIWEIRRYEWLMDPRNRRASLIDLVVGLIYFSRNDRIFVAQAELDRLKEQQQRLREEAAALKSRGNKAFEKLREKGLIREEYQAAVQELNGRAEQVAQSAQTGTRRPRVDFSKMSEQERLEYYQAQIRAQRGR